MKTIWPDLTTLQNLFASRASVMAELYQFNLVNGNTLYYTSADVDINWNSQIWNSGGPYDPAHPGAGGPYFGRGSNKAKAHWKIGTDVDQLVFDVIPGKSDVDGTGFMLAVIQGIFDGAELIYNRAYWGAGTALASPLTPTAVIQNIFVGRVAELDGGRSFSTFTVNSHMELLNQNFPRNLFQSGCVNTLYDAACTLNQTDFAVTGTASSGSTAAAINAALTQATGYFDLGMIQFTSGLNNGQWRTVSGYTHGSPSVVSLIAPFPNAPTAGDSFTIYPGCDKTQLTCGNKFNNLIHFRGFPYIPSVENAV